MEYVPLKVVHPTWLTTQMPIEVAQLLRYPTADGPERGAARSISFLARGAGIARVIAPPTAREALAVETVRGRLLASARPGDRHLFSLPTAVIRHLGLQVYARGPKAGRRTDDRIVWFVPAAEYYEFRSVVGAKKTWTGPSSGPFAHVYLTKSLVPFSRELGVLAELELRIEEEEWRPGVEALQRVGRGRKVVL